MMNRYDIAIVGSGFAGSLLAMIARRLGYSVALIERGKHPRFAIGESTTPLANLVLEELATRYDLPRLLPLTKWGSWQRTHPEITCGLKRGFTFLHHGLGERFATGAREDNQLLVAASPHDEIADTHWFRAEIDQFLVKEAQALGVAYMDETALEGFAEFGEDALLEGTRGGRPVTLRAGFVVDASGPRGFLHKALRLREVSAEPFPPVQALFTHFSGVRRFDEVEEFRDPTPYAIDDAALHHVFDGGWIWVLRFNNGVTSAGVAARSDLAEQLRFSEGAPAWERLLRLLPSVGRQFAGARPLREFSYLRQVSFRSEAIVGNRWALLPSAAGFIDPLLSTGFPLTLFGVARLAEAFGHAPGSDPFRKQLGNYAVSTEAELGATSRLLATLYATMGDFPTFADITRLYFAAASFSETARRLGRSELAGDFLMHDHPNFGPTSRRLCERVTSGLSTTEGSTFRKEVMEAIEPFDIAGLSYVNRRNYHPALATDLLAANAKLGATKAEITSMLERCGFNGSRQAVPA
jgi:FADH2 O2-dependent halogenase